MFVRKLEATKLITSGNSTKLECTVKGTPPIGVRWFKDEMELKPSPKHNMAFTDSVASLEISDCTLEDSGNYSSVASSEAGSDRCSSTVTVKGWSDGHSGHPGMHVKFLSCGMEGASVDATCSAGGNDHDMNLIHWSGQ